MTIEEFAEFVRATCVTPEGGRGGLDYALMKICAEAGEVAQLRAKEILVGNPPGPQAGGGSLDRRARFALELGDVAWYLFELCDLLGLTFEQVLDLNQRKLVGRRIFGKDPAAEQLEATRRLKSLLVGEVLP